MMLPNLIPFMAGAVAMGFALSGLAFLRLWRRTGDWLFLAFAAAFWLLMLPSLSVLFSLPDETDSWIYLFRVFAYLLIMLAIVLKNRRRLGHLAHSPRSARRDKRPWGA